MSRVASLYASPDELSACVSSMAAQVIAWAPENLFLVTMLHGAVPFSSDLARRLGPDVEVDFLRLSAYAEGERAPGIARIVKDLEGPIAGRHVLVVEDVVDTGLSLRFLLRNLEQRDPASLRVCTLLDRTSKRLLDTPIAVRGFEIGGEFLVGYGLDFHGLYRNLPCLVAIEDLDALRADPLALVPLLREWGIW